MFGKSLRLSQEGSGSQSTGSDGGGGANSGAGGGGASVNLMSLDPMHVFNMFAMGNIIWSGPVTVCLVVVVVVVTYVLRLEDIMSLSLLSTQCLSSALSARILLRFVLLLLLIALEREIER